MTGQAEHAEQSAHAEQEAHAAHPEHAHANYVRIWQILVGLLMVSVAGPFVGIQFVTLVTAFGVAVVKAYLVAKHFMHINIEKRFIAYITVTVLVFMFLFFAGVAPDVMKPSGDNWVKPGWVEVNIDSDLGLHEEHH